MIVNSSVGNSPRNYPGTSKQKSHVIQHNFCNVGKPRIKIACLAFQEVQKRRFNLPTVLVPLDIPSPALVPSPCKLKTAHTTFGFPLPAPMNHALISCQTIPTVYALWLLE